MLAQGWCLGHDEGLRVGPGLVCVFDVLTCLGVDGPLMVMRALPRPWPHSAVSHKYDHRAPVLDNTWSQHTRDLPHTLFTSL